jgi:hypothetical protein
MTARSLWISGCIVLALALIGGACALGHSRAPDKADMARAQSEAYMEAYNQSFSRSLAHAHQRGLDAGRAEGTKSGEQKGATRAATDAGDAIAASQPPPLPSSTGGCPPGSDAFGTPPACIARPAPGVSPEYDLCVAQGGTPTPDGCLKP